MMADSGKKVEVTMQETKQHSNDKGKGVKWADPVSSDSTKATPITGPRWRKGVAITDFVLRLGAIGAAMGTAATMGTNEEQLPFFTQFLQFHAQWAQFPMFQFLVMASGAVSGYVVLTLPFSYVCIVRPHAVAPRLLLITCDIVMMGLITAGASAAAVIVYVGHNGSQEPNWMAFCPGFTNFCQAASQAVVTAFITSVFFICLITLSALALKRS